MNSEESEKSSHDIDSMPEEDNDSCSTCRFDFQAIEGYEQVLQLLGYWPCFHDGILESIHLDSSTARVGLDIRVQVRFHRMLKEVDERGYYKLVDHGKLALLFRRATLESLSTDMFPDVLLNFCLETLEPKVNHHSLKVQLVGIGVIYFMCDDAEILEAYRISAPSIAKP